jgi:hypothetical protein
VDVRDPRDLEPPRNHYEKLSHDTGKTPPGHPVVAVARGTELALQNGAKAIIVTGKVAEQQLNAKGTLRVLGVLRSGGKTGHPALEVKRSKC